METAPAPSLANLLGLAKHAELAGNFEEAHGYFNRVLEIDSTHSDAWLGKGRAAGHLSTLANLRIGETLLAFGHAIATSADELKQAVAARALDEITSICSALYWVSREHFVKFRTAAGVAASYFGTSVTIAETLTQAQGWTPDDRRTLGEISTIYRDVLGAETPADLRPELRERLYAVEVRIAAIDPDFQQQPTDEERDALARKEQRKMMLIGGAVFVAMVIILQMFSH